LANTRDLRRRIRSVKNTQQLTRAMKMVAAARLRRAQEQILAARPYAHRMREVLARLAANTDVDSHPLLAERGNERVEVLVVTSDRGLCGSFNSSIIKRTEKFLAEPGRQNTPMHLVGRKAADYFKRRPVTVHASYSDVFRNFGLIQRFIGGELDAVYMCFNEFKSAIAQDVVVQKLLPLERIEAAESHHEYLYEPPPKELLDALLHRHVNVQLWAALLESNAAENGARMSAMDAATKNAGELIDKLTLQMNRIRQAAITREIIEVVSGADALG
jgi:F-type H+-transporting ATPase subunit gamma